MFKKVITFGEMDYNSLSRWWHETLMKYHNVDRFFPFWTLVEITQKNSLEELQQTVTDYLTTERILALTYKPLTPNEVIENFSN